MRSRTKLLAYGIFMCIFILGFGTEKALAGKTGTLTPFNLVFPPSGLTLKTSPLDSTIINISWTSSSMGATYKWKFGAPDLGSVVLDIPSNNSGNDTILTVTPSAVDGILAGLGVMPGDSVVGKWAVYAFEGGDSLKSVETYDITFRRNALEPFNLVFPPTGLTFVSIAGDTNKVNITWTASSMGATYKWKFGAPDLGTVILDLPSNSSGSDTVLTVTPGAVDGILAGLGLMPGDSVVGKWAAFAFKNGDSLKSVETFDITFRRSDHTSIQVIGNVIPERFDVSQNYPNPFNPVTKINFDIPSKSFVTLKVYDVSGKEVVTLVNQDLNPGRYIADFNGVNLSSGVYFYKLEAADFTEVKRMMLVK